MSAVRVPLSMISALALLTLIAVPTALSTPLYLQNPEGGAIRGLIIGIDAYEHVRQLKGSVADARDIDGSLRSMGTSDITTLVDGQANRVNILQNISSLVQRTKANDLIILSIAGHGAQEPETVKGSEPDGMQDVFLLPGFEPTPDGSRQRILGSEFNHFIRQFELRGARVLFVADTCHGGGMAREIDPRAAEMSFRQVPHYTLPVDKLVPVTNEADPVTDLDLDHTAFLAAVDRYTKAPEVKIPGIEGLRGALSYAIARALEGGADADHDGKVTLKELFANVRQVVYQLSDQRQNVVTKTSPGQSPDKDVVFQLTRGLPPAPSQPAATQPAATTSVVANASQNRDPSPAESVPARSALPIRVAALDGGTNYFAKLTSRDATIEIVRPIDDPDIIWDPKSRDVISWGDVIAYKVDQGDLATVIDRTAAIRELKKIATKAPQSVRVGPDDAKYHNEQVVQIELSDLAGRALVLFDISGDGTIQMLYPIGSDDALRHEASLQLPLRVREPFGAEQVVAITSTERMIGLEQGLLQLNLRKAPGQLIKIMTKLLPSDARIGSIGFYTAP
ncbi:MAG: caspase family protein [Bradyrhizobium sp.]